MLDDELLESTETLDVQISNPSSAAVTIATATATATAEDIAEHVTEDVAEGIAEPAKSSRTTGTSSTHRRIDARMPELSEHESAPHHVACGCGTL